MLPASRQWGAPDERRGQGLHRFLVVLMDLATLAAYFCNNQVRLPQDSLHHAHHTPHEAATQVRTQYLIWSVRLSHVCNFSMHFIFLFLGSKYLCDPFPWILTNTTYNRVSLNWEFVWRAAAKIINKLVHMTPELKCTVIILSGSLKPHNVLPILSWYDKLDGKIIGHCVFFPLACLWVMLHLFVRDLSQYWPEVSPEEATAVLPPNRSVCFTRSLCVLKKGRYYTMCFSYSECFFYLTPIAFT